jgi:hypothetical protein
MQMLIIFLIAVGVLFGRKAAAIVAVIAAILYAIVHI